MARKLAIIGMGCTAAGGRYGRNQEALLVDAGMDAIADAGIERERIQSVWAWATGANQALNFALKIGYTGQTGASGPDILRCAYLGVASGAYDIVLAAAVEKLSDALLTDFDEGAGSAGTAGPTGAVGVEENANNSRAAATAGLYLTRYGHAMEVPPERLRGALSRIVARNRRAGARNERAGIRAPLSEGEVENAPRSAGPLTVADCAEPGDGAAAAVICGADIAEQLGRPYVLVDGMGMATAGGSARHSRSYDYTGLPEVRVAATRAYAMAGITDPETEIDHAEIWDVTSASELLAYEDLGLAPRGKAIDYVLGGVFDLEGRTPCNTDGGLLSNGNQPHGGVLRQLYEAYVQVLGRAGERQVPGIRRSLVHTVAGTVDSHSAFVQVLSRA